MHHDLSLGYRLRIISTTSTNSIFILFNILYDIIKFIYIFPCQAQAREDRKNFSESQADASLRPGLFACY